MLGNTASYIDTPHFFRWLALTIHSNWIMNLTIHGKEFAVPRNRMPG